MMLDKMQIEKIINLNNQLNEDIGKLQIENDVLLAKNNLLQEENEKLKSELRGIDIGKIRQEAYYDGYGDALRDFYRTIVNNEDLRKVVDKDV
jgi:cell division protein FtsB